MYWGDGGEGGESGGVSKSDDSFGYELSVKLLMKKITISACSPIPWNPR